MERPGLHTDSVTSHRRSNLSSSFYLGEHTSRTNRILHIVGTLIGLGISCRILLGLAPILLRLLPSGFNVSTTKHTVSEEMGRRIGLTPRGFVRWFALAIVQGYGFAWIGHFVVEENSPATIKVGLQPHVSRLTIRSRRADITS